MRVGVSQGYSRSRTHCRRRVWSDVFFSFPTHTLPVVSRHSSAAYSLKLCRRHFLRGATSCRLSVSHLDQTLETLCCHFCFVFFHHRRMQQILKWNNEKKNYFVCIAWLNNLWISWESESCPLNGHLDFCYHPTFSTLVKYQNTEDLGKLQSKISTTTSLQPSLVLLCPSSHTHAFLSLYRSHHTIFSSSLVLIFVAWPHATFTQPLHTPLPDPPLFLWKFERTWENLRPTTRQTC